MTETGKLYVVGTPIGNLSDFSPRGIETLESVDYIAAEDTRVTLRLLTHFGIKKPLLSYYKPHEAEKKRKDPRAAARRELRCAGKRRRNALHFRPGGVPCSALL